MKFKNKIKFKKTIKKNQIQKIIKLYSYGQGVGSGKQSSGLGSVAYGAKDNGL